MERAISVIKRVAQETDRVILFHSASGKDSIALLDLLYPHFKQIVCVFMYVVKDLEHINRYIRYAKTKYPRITFIQTPHYAAYSYWRSGYLGCKRLDGVKDLSLSNITDIVREKFGIEWVVCGFKQTDSMNRLLMLRGYDQEAISYKTKKFYPLSTYKNSDVLRYISEKGLMTPEKYGKGQSAGTSVQDIDYLLFLRDKFPKDLEKVLSEYPLAERYIFEYDYKKEASKAE